VSAVASRNNRTALMSALLGLAMLGLAFASVPLYRLFCQVTGYGGTTQRVEQASATVGGAPISVRFDANTKPGLPWKFEPVQEKIEVVPGQQVQILYRATNFSAEPTTGRAGFNVSPGQTGKYFNKIQCFCFTEQTLQPGQTVDMPVLFYVDPKLRDDEDTKALDEITLSYTFYPVETARSAS